LKAHNRKTRDFIAAVIAARAVAERAEARGREEGTGRG